MIRSAPIGGMASDERDPKPPTVNRVTGAALAAAARRGDGLPDSHRMRHVAVAYARLGLRVLPLWHRRPDGSCACNNPAHLPGGAGERDIAKHPRIPGGVRVRPHS